MTEQFKIIKSAEVFKDAIDNHFIPLLEDTYRQRIQVKWVSDSVCMLRYLEPLSNGMGRPVVKSIFWDKINSRAEHVDGELPKGQPKNLN